MDTKMESNSPESLPHDLVTDILSRLPVKSLCRFRCVSQQWNSTISDQSFIESHFHHALSRSDGTSLIITFPDSFHCARSFYAVDHRENDDPVAVNVLTVSGFANHYVSESLHGLICLEVGSLYRICNPSLREFITLPNVENDIKYPRPYNLFAMTQFGYDPVNCQHKVLNIFVLKKNEDAGDDEDMMMENKVFVLGDCSWRRVSSDCSPHYPNSNGVCIDGVIYYKAWTRMRSPHIEVVVAFDVELETFRFIPMPSGELHLYEHSAMIRHDGSVAIIDYQCLTYVNMVEIWILEDDPVKPNWIHKSITFSSVWNDMIGDRDFYLADTLRNGEIIMVPSNLKAPFYVFYLNLKIGSIRRVEIHCLPDHKLRCGGVFRGITATDHVESILSLSNQYHSTSS